MVTAEKNKPGTDKVAVELALFYLFLGDRGNVQEYELRKSFPCGMRTIIRYARELETIGALPRVHLSRNIGELRLSCDMDGFVPHIRTDHDTAHLNRLSRLACVIGSYYYGSYPDYRSLYAGMNVRTLQRDKRIVLNALCRWAAYEYEYEPSDDVSDNWEFYEFIYYWEEYLGIRSGWLPKDYDPEEY